MQLTEVLFLEVGELVLGLEVWLELLNFYLLLVNAVCEVEAICRLDFGGSLDKHLSGSCQEFFFDWIDKVNCELRLKRYVAEVRVKLSCMHAIKRRFDFH